MMRLLVLGLTAISLLAPTVVGAQKVTPLTVKIEPGGQVTVPFQGPELNLVTGAVVTVGDGTPVSDVVARIIRPLPTSLSIIVFAIPAARPRPDYQVWLQTSVSRTPIHAVTVQVVPKASAKGTQSPPAQTTPPPAQTTRPAALTLVSIAVSPAQVGGGGVVNTTITLSAVAPAGGTQVTLVSDRPIVASVPPTLTVPAGQSSVGFRINTRAVAADTAVTVSATLGATTRTAILTVGVPRLNRVSSSFRDAPHDLWNVFVELDGPAPVGGAVVALTSQNTAVARVPATLTVPQGQTLGFAPIDFTRGTSPIVVMLTGVYAGVAKTGTVGVNPLPPLPVVSSVTPLSAPPGGQFTICGINLTTFVSLGSRLFGASSGGTGGGCPLTEGRMTFGVPMDLTPGIYTLSMETAGAPWISPQPFTVAGPGAPNPGAQQGGPLALVSITVDPAQVGGGHVASGTISLSTVAPAGGTQVTLASDKPLVASMLLSTPTIPAGQSSVGFQITTFRVTADTPVTLSATLGTTTRTTILTVGVPRLSRIFGASRDSVHDLLNVAAELDGPAPSGGAVINLTSQNTAVARVPATVTIPQGRTLGLAPIDITRGPSVVIVTLSGEYGGVTKTGTVGVNPLPPPPLVTSVTPMSARPLGQFTVCGTNLSVFISLGSRLFASSSGGTGGGCPLTGGYGTFQVPADVTPGSYTLSMENAGGIWLSPQNFTVTAP